MRVLGALLASVLFCFVVGVMPICAGQTSAKAAELSISIGDETKTFNTADLLRHPDLKQVEVQSDIAYGRTMRFSAVPLLSLTGALDHQRHDTLEARAVDGFISQIPIAMVLRARNDGAVAWIAVEDAQTKWPNLPGKDYSAGPFYLIWQFPDRSGVKPTYWPYALASLTAVASPLQRWPQLAVADRLPQDAPERIGLTVFVSNCLACHRMNGGGDSEIGPDLGRPMSPTQYMTLTGLKRLIRNPASVRAWPNMQMSGFDVDAISNAELDALVGYLAHKAGH